MYHRLPYVSGGIFGRLDIMHHILPCIRMCLALQISCTLYIPAERHNPSNQPFYQLYSPCYQSQRYCVRILLGAIY
jgi:hypothetical protein